MKHKDYLQPTLTYMRETVLPWIERLYPFRSFLFDMYLLQLENYAIERFVKTALRHTTPIRTQRSEIVWTKKMMVVFAGSLLLFFLFLLIITNFIAGNFFPLNVWPLLTFIIFLLIFSPLFTFFIAGAVYVLTPLDFYLKRKEVAQAREKLLAHKALTVIGVTGSYGKTTMKEALLTVLRQKFNVLATEENRNTPLGVAELLLSKLTPSVEILLVEMGAYKRGDIRELVDFVKPSVGVITGINEAHLERQGSIENIIVTKFELIEGLPEGGYALLNKNDERVEKNASRFVANKQVEWYGEGEGKEYRVEDGGVDLSRKGRKLIISQKATGTTREVILPILGGYVLAVVEATLLVGSHLGMTFEEMVRGIERLRPAPHRLEVVRFDEDLVIIDDSYNGNPAGVKEALRVLGAFAGRRRLYVTPGLVELGEKSAEIHEKMGGELAKNAEVVMLVENSATPSLKKGLLEAGFSEENIFLYTSAPQMHASLNDHLRKGDVVLFQNDWPDNYL